MASSKVQVQRIYEVPDEVITDVVLDMLHPAIQYWAAEWEVNEEERYVRVRVRDDDDKTVFNPRVVQYADIAKAMVDLAFSPEDFGVARYYREQLFKFFGELDANEEFPGGDIDVEIADIIIQVAVLGKVIYG
jgi:hypothetical protein